MSYSLKLASKALSLLTPLWQSGAEKRKAQSRVREKQCWGPRKQSTFANINPSHVLKKVGTTLAWGHFLHFLLESPNDFSRAWEAFCQQRVQSARKRRFFACAQQKCGQFAVSHSWRRQQAWLASTSTVSRKMILLAFGSSPVESQVLVSDER